MGLTYDSELFRLSRAGNSPQARNHSINPAKMVNCAVVGCTSNSSRVKKIGYHKLPSEEKYPELRQAWLEKLSRVDPVTKRQLFVLLKNCYVCSDHFTVDDYEFSVNFRLIHFPNKKTNRLLKKDAVPSKNMDLTSKRGLSFEDLSLEELLGSKEIQVKTATARDSYSNTSPATTSRVKTLPAKVSTVKTSTGTTLRVKTLPAKVSTVKTSPGTTLSPLMTKTLPAEKSSVGTSKIKTSLARKTAVRIGPDGQKTTYWRPSGDDGYLYMSKYHYDDDTSNHLEPHLSFRTGYSQQLNRRFVPAKNRILLPKGESANLVTSNQTNYVQIYSSTPSVSLNAIVNQPKTKPGLNPKNKTILKTAVPTKNRMLLPKLDSSSPEQVAYVKIDSHYVKVQPSVEEIVNHRATAGPVQVIRNSILKNAAPSKNPILMPKVDASVSNASKCIVLSAFPGRSGCARVTPIRPLMTDAYCNKDGSVKNHPSTSASLGTNVDQSGDQATVEQLHKTAKQPPLKPANFWHPKTTRVLRKSSVPSKYRIFKSKGESSENGSCPVTSPEAADQLTSPEEIDILTPSDEFAPFELLSDEFKIELPDEMTDCVKVEGSDPLSSSFADSAGICDHGSPLKEEPDVKMESDSTDTASESEIYDEDSTNKRKASTNQSKISHKRRKICRDKSLWESDFDVKPDLVKLEPDDCDLSVCRITEDAATQCEMGWEIYRKFDQNYTDSPTETPKIRVKTLSELTIKSLPRPNSPSDFIARLIDAAVQCEMGKEI